MQLIETGPRFTPGASRVSVRQFRALHEILPALYAETDRTRLPQVFADALARIVPGETHGVVVQDSVSGRRSWYLRPAAPEHASLVPSFFANFHEFAPANYRRTAGGDSGTALALSDFVDHTALERLLIYREYYRPLGLEDDLSINVRCGETKICAAVMRARRGFRPDERELMNAVRPHFQQAWHNAANVARLHDAADAATSRATREWTAGPLEAQYGLSPREAEVLIWVAQGKTNGEAAMILGIRPNTVRTHLERVFLKLGVETRHAAGLRAIEVLGLPHG